MEDRALAEEVESPHIMIDDRATIADEEGVKEGVERVPTVTGKRQRGQTLTSQRSRTSAKRRDSIDSVMTESRYAVLPHGASLDGWSKEDKQELNDHVRHMLHSRRSKFKQSMKGFGKYIRRRKSHCRL